LPLDEKDGENTAPPDETAELRERQPRLLQELDDRHQVREIQRARAQGRLLGCRREHVRAPLPAQLEHLQRGVAAHDFAVSGEHLRENASPCADFRPHPGREHGAQHAGFRLEDYSTRGLSVPRVVSFRD